jgi:peptidoglycan/LPS O-acetylase OafA/YrhL
MTDFPPYRADGGRLDLATANFNRIEAADGRYRPDIDGLRALAVLSVVLFHFRIPPFSGGFVGVDIFFVISGFLITRLIWSEIGAGRFAFLDFYERRVRRILPALFAMLAVVTVASVILLFPQMLVNYAMSLIATAGFASNFHFWGYTSYWAPAAVEQPLLHTWSLAVEEQFYLIFPPFLLMFRHRSQRVVLWAMIGTLALSLAISVVSVRYSPVSAFYLLPSRFWELLTGSVLAVGRFTPLSGIILRNAVAAIGLAMIAYTVFALSAASPFPGLNAIPPCLGAALVIYAGTGVTDAHPAPLVNAALATRVPVFIGLISYSLYLWHWPIIVLATAVLPRALDAGQTIVAIAASFLLATLSWRFVEQPFRGRHSEIARKPLFVAGAATIAVFCRRRDRIGGRARLAATLRRRYAKNTCGGEQRTDAGAVLQSTGRQDCARRTLPVRRA